jgi:hypothetical protein
MTISSVRIESGDTIFRVENDLLIDVPHHKLIRNFSTSSSIMIPCQIESLGSFSFSYCKSFSSITFESNSRLTRIESEAFRESSLQSILIPKSVELFGPRCFLDCWLLSSITFESDSRLKRIKSCAFSGSALQSIQIPRNVQFIDGSAIRDMKSSSIRIESGNELFCVKDDFLIDVIHHKLIRSFSTSSSIIIPYWIESLGSSCLSCCESLSSIRFGCPSQLKRIESSAFDGMKKEIIIPSTIRFIASEAFCHLPKVSLSDHDSCPEFDRWLTLKMRDIDIDFRRILSCDPNLLDLTDSLSDVSDFEEESLLCEGVSCQLYRRSDDGCLIVVKSLPLLTSLDPIKSTMNLRHRWLVPPIGFVFPKESSTLRELKIAQLFANGASLAEVLVANPEWWTPTAKAKAVAGIALGLRFAHSFGLVHGRLTASNTLFDGDHCIQITDFHPVGFEGRESDTAVEAGFRGDVRAFISLLLEIVTSYPATLSGGADDEETVGPRVSEVVSRIMELSQRDSGRRYSFNNIIHELEQHQFEIVDGVDSGEVLAFVQWVELLEQLDE